MKNQVTMIGFLFMMMFPMISRAEIIFQSTNEFLQSPLYKQEFTHADIVLLGEIHDNVNHHLGQAELIRLLADENTAVVFEMLPAVLQSKIDAYQGTVADFGEAMDWKGLGWPDYDSNYMPIFEAIHQKGAKIIAGNLPLGMARRVVSEGLTILDAKMIEIFKVPDLAPAVEQTNLLNEQFEAHCGMVAREKLAGMVDAQRARDIAISYASLEAAKTYSKIIIITGRGHVRKDNAIPFYLMRSGFQGKVFALAFGEFGESQEGVEQTFDAMIYTEGVPSRGDVCAKFKK